VFVFQWAGFAKWDTKAQSTDHSHKPNIFIFLSLPKNLWLVLRITGLSLEIPRPFVCQKKRAFDYSLSFSLSLSLLLKLL
jgi:hypothetical protein